ncbi:Aldehyde reductase 2 [Cercospora beticola]|uniref:Aldehyde reductase 2 n=1 Tax=Cercospora beticola TaxID=122368 RepID=A0A2G5I7G5_CERBT|nr:Aldehyde reductase 2 [Cercospora beticola]PIB00776.1 Aldehyde reductase 2 [Cercospora beticola]WPA95439.1 hypothetical protein RHO25_000038 [Cercospora beticola]
MSPDPNKVIPATITGVKHALEAAAATDTVKRVVYTSSVVTLPSFAPGVVGHITASEWNVEAVKAAWAPPPYDQSRMLKEKKPSFTFNTVLPGLVLGPILDGANSSMAGFVQGIHGGDENATQLIRNLPEATWHVDVEDTAIVHVAALLDDSVRGERILTLGEPFTYQRAIETLRRIDPSKTDYAEPLPGDQENRVVADTSRAVELLKKNGRDGVTSLEQSLSNQFSR